MYSLPNRWEHVFLLLLLLFLAGACRRSAPPTPSLEPAPTLTVMSTPTATLPISSPTPEAANETAPVAATALAYYRAWAAQDYGQMYAALSPESQARIDSQSFVTFYEEAMTAAAVEDVQAELLAVARDETQAELSVRVVWQTAVAGEIIREHQVQLVKNQERWGVVWHEGLLLPELQPGQLLRLVPGERIPRAEIYDMNGRLLAHQGTVATLGVIPGQIANEEGLLAALAPLLEQTSGEIKALYEDAAPDQNWPVADITGDVLDTHSDQLQPHVGAGLTIQERSARLYPAGSAAAHIIGYTGFIPAGQLERYQAEGYLGDEQVGLTGLEAWGERYLSGVGNVLVIEDDAGNRVTVIPESTAQSVYTTIDLELQQAVAEALATAVTTHPEGSAGAVIVLDVATGQVRAMTSFPTYDPAIFDPLRLHAVAGLNEALNDPQRPLLNRAAQSEYPPGSTFKIVTMAAALNSGLYTPDTEYTSTGSWDRLGSGFIKYDWQEGGHGTLTLVEALMASCNSCFYEATYRLNEADPDLLPQTARQFGFGTPAGIDAIQEAAGLVPDPEYKLNVQGTAWEAGDAVNMGIGQGFVLVTPLQLAQVIAAIANDGVLLQPTLVNRIGANEETVTAQPAEPVGALPLRSEHLDAIREGLWGVANDPSLGTAVEPLDQLAIPVAGKTGTSETGGEPHAWFAGYAPAMPYTRPDGVLVTEPEIAIVVLMENAGEGSEVAAPIFRRVVELYYGIQPLTPYPWE